MKSGTFLTLTCCLFFIFQYSACSDDDNYEITVEENRGSLIAELPENSQLLGWINDEEVIVRQPDAIVKFSSVTGVKTILVNGEIIEAKIANGYVYYRSRLSHDVTLSSVYRIGAGEGSIPQEIISDANSLGPVSPDGQSTHR